MYYINDIILKIKENPGVYLGEKSIRKLSTFLSGYECAIYEIKGVRSCVNSKFQIFVQKKYGIKATSLHWSDIISKDLDSEEAFSLFFDIWKEFVDSENPDDA